ncbi:MAG: DUF4097 family beta strand repeat protein [Clostridia bacterium]|nr:DUF4097 family beta strand repeat protein [Clostridia bacterium]
MRKVTKKWLILATSLILVGGLIFGGVIAMLKWDFTKLSTVKYQTNTYEIGDAFTNISIKTDTADIIFALSDDGKCKVECYEEENAKHSVTVKDGTLTVELIDKKAWYDYIGINLGSPKITVYLPKTEYSSLLIKEHTGDIVMPKDFNFEDVNISLSTGDVDFCASALRLIKIKTSTGDIRVENISVGALDLSVSTGKVTVTGANCVGDITVGVSTGKAYFTDVKCNNITTNGNTGDITFKNVVAKQNFSIERSTGDVTFDGVDANEIFVKTDTGDVRGSLLSGKKFITTTDTGDIKVPKTVSGGKCEITTNTGDIKITLK